MDVIIRTPGIQPAQAQYKHNKPLLLNSTTLIKWLYFYIASSIASIITLILFQLNLFQVVITIFIESISSSIPTLEILLYVTRTIGLSTLLKIFKKEYRMDGKVRAIAIGELVLELVYLYVNMGAALSTSYTITHLLYMAFFLGDYVTMFAVIVGNALDYKSNTGQCLYNHEIVNLTSEAAVVKYNLALYFSACCSSISP
jgi:hypothetical protein